MDDTAVRWVGRRASCAGGAHAKHNRASGRSNRVRAGWVWPDLRWYGGGPELHGDGLGLAALCGDCELRQAACEALAARQHSPVACSHRRCRRPGPLAKGRHVVEPQIMVCGLPCGHGTAHGAPDAITAIKFGPGHRAPQPPLFCQQR